MRIQGHGLHFLLYKVRFEVPEVVSTNDIEDVAVFWGKISQDKMTRKVFRVLIDSSVAINNDEAIILELESSESNSPWGLSSVEAI